MKLKSHCARPTLDAGAASTVTKPLTVSARSSGLGSRVSIGVGAMHRRIEVRHQIFSCPVNPAVAQRNSSFAAHSQCRLEQHSVSQFLAYAVVVLRHNVGAWSLRVWIVPA
jgi:hypothetical protein